MSQPAPMIPLGEPLSGRSRPQDGPANGLLVRGLHEQGVPIVLPLPPPTDDPSDRSSEAPRPAAREIPRGQGLRTERVFALRGAIGGGRYDVDATELAEQLLGLL